MPRHPFDVSIIVPAFNRVELTLACLDALARHTDDGASAARESAPLSYEVIVVDNGSTDGTPEALASFAGDLRVIRNETNLGFARACNQGAIAARGRYFLFLNNDTEVGPGWLWPLVALADGDPRVGIAGSKLLYPDGRIQHVGVVVSEGWEPCHLYRTEPRAESSFVNRSRDFQAVTAACMLLRRGVAGDERPFDEAFVNGYEDVDLCLRVREAGYRVVYCAESVVVHHEGRTEGRHERTHANLALLRERWAHRVAEDEADYFLADGWFRSSRDGVWAWCGFDPDCLTTGKGGPPSLAVVTRAGRDAAELAGLLHAVGRHTTCSHEVIVVDDGASNEIASLLEIFVRRPGYRVARVPESGGDSGRLSDAETLAAAAAVARAPRLAFLPPGATVFLGWESRAAFTSREDALAAPHLA